MTETENSGTDVRRSADRQTDRQTDRQIDRRTDELSSLNEVISTNYMNLKIIMCYGSPCLYVCVCACVTESEGDREMEWPTEICGRRKGKKREKEEKREQ